MSSQRACKAHVWYSVWSRSLFHSHCYFQFYRLDDHDGIFQTMFWSWRVPLHQLPVFWVGIFRLSSRSSLFQSNCFSGRNPPSDSFTLCSWLPPDGLCPPDPSTHIGLQHRPVFFITCQSKNQFLLKVSSEINTDVCAGQQYEVTPPIFLLWSFSVTQLLIHWIQAMLTYQVLD